MLVDCYNNLNWGAPKAEMGNEIFSVLLDLDALITIMVLQAISKIGKEEKIYWKSRDIITAGKRKYEAIRTRQSI